MSRSPRMLEITEVATSGILKLRNEQGVIINNDVTSTPVIEPKPKQG